MLKNQGSALEEKRQESQTMSLNSKSYCSDSLKIRIYCLFLSGVLEDIGHVN